MTTEGEHGQIDEGFGLLEAEGHPGKKADLGVGGLDQALREAGVEGDIDGPR